MAWLKKKDGAWSRLNGAVTSSDTTITVSDATKFPTTFDFLLTLWDDSAYATPTADANREVVKVTGAAGNILTVTRAQAGTTAVGHTSGNMVGLYDHALLWEEHEPAQVVTVAKSGGQFQTIQEAIDSITDASSSKKYVVQIYPGTYTEAVTGGAYICLQGMGAARGQVIIAQSSGTILTLPTDGPVGVTSIKLEATGTATAIALGSGSSSTYRFFDCGIAFSQAEGYTDLITISSGTLKLVHCQVRYTSTGTTSGANDHRCIYVNGLATYHIHGTHIDMAVGDADDTVYAIYEDTSAEVIVLIIDSEITITCTGAAEAIAYYTESVTELTDIQSNFFHLTGAAGGTGTVIKLADAAMVVHTTANRVRVTGFDFDYFANIGASATLVSHFDDIVAVDRCLCAGTLTEVHSHTDGELAVEEIDLETKLRHRHDATGYAPGTEATILDIVIDDEGSSGGMVHAVDVAAGAVAGSTEIAAVGTHAGVKPIMQHIGTAANLAAAFLYDDSEGTYADVTTEFDAAGSDVAIFVGDEDQVLIASATKFDEIAFALDTVASGNLLPTFHYVEGGGNWVAFAPGDDTDGFTGSSLVRWEADGLTTWGVRTIDEITGGGDALDDYYWIKITRTKNFVVTVPIENLVHVTAVGDYGWDENGDVTMRKLEIIMFSQAGKPDVTDCPAGKMVLWHDTDDAKLYICVNDGGTVKIVELA